MSFNGNLQPSSDEGTDLTTKGDIHGFSTENVRVPVGTNGHVLTARSTNSNGIAWETSAGGAETHEFTTAETWNPTTQTGIMEVLVDVRNMTAGSMTVTIDGSLKETLTTSSTTSSRIYKPSSSIAIASLDGNFGLVNSFDFGTSQVPAGNLVSVTLGDSGSKMYLCSNSASDNQATYQYTLSTPYDVSTASYASISFPDPVSADIRGMSWKPDGSRWARCSDQTGNKKFYDFTTSSNWDISTSSSASNFQYDSYQSGGKDVIYGDSGNQVTSLADNASINTYDLSTPYTVSSASDTAKDVILSSIDNAPRSHAWNSDGTKCFYLGAQNDKVYQLDCSTPWDITSYSHSAANDIDVSSESADPYGLWVKNEVTPSAIYVGSTNSPYSVYQYGDVVFAGIAFATVGQ